MLVHVINIALIVRPTLDLLVKKVVIKLVIVMKLFKRSTDSMVILLHKHQVFCIRSQLLHFNHVLFVNSLKETRPIMHTATTLFLRLSLIFISIENTCLLNLVMLNKLFLG